jgi:hypothetical protein
MFLKKNVWQLWKIFLGDFGRLLGLPCKLFLLQLIPLNFLPVGKKLALIFHDLAF